MGLSGPFSVVLCDCIEGSQPQIVGGKASLGSSGVAGIFHGIVGPGTGKARV